VFLDEEIFVERGHNIQGAEGASSHKVARGLADAVARRGISIDIKSREALGRRAVENVAVRLHVVLHDLMLALGPRTYLIEERSVYAALISVHPRCLPGSRTRKPTATGSSTAGSARLVHSLGIARGGDGIGSPGKQTLMAATSTIEWTDATWNPTSGCTKVSPGCDNCYAMKFAERFRGVYGHYYETGFDLVLRPNMLDRPAQWKKSRRIFVDSMSDLFQVGVPDEYLDLVFERMESIDHHVYQVLTKRPERMRRYLKRRYAEREMPAHIWIGVSVENNDYAWRADMLRETQAKVKFLSVEPMLGPVDQVSFEGITWIIVGGESGPRHRPMEANWVRSVRDRCCRGGVSFFFKQWHKKGTGRDLDGRTWDELPKSGAAIGD